MELVLHAHLFGGQEEAAGVRAAPQTVSVSLKVLNHIYCSRPQAWWWTLMVRPDTFCSGLMMAYAGTCKKNIQKRNTLLLHGYESAVVNCKMEESAGTWSEY